MSAEDLDKSGIEEEEEEVEPTPEEIAAREARLQSVSFLVT